MRIDEKAAPAEPFMIVPECPQAGDPSVDFLRGQMSG